MNVMLKSLSSDLIAQLAAIKLVIFDFDGVFTDNTVWVNQDGIESIRCSRSDGLGLKRISKLGVLTQIVSTEKNPVVSVRAKKLGIACTQDVEDKSIVVEELMRFHGLKKNQVAYVGNDINDIPAFQMVGLPIATADAYEEILACITLQTKTKGGRGAVREVCDLIYFSQLK